MCQILLRVNHHGMEYIEIFRSDSSKQKKNLKKIYMFFLALLNALATRIVRMTAAIVTRTA